MMSSSLTASGSIAYWLRHALVALLTLLLALLFTFTRDVEFNLGELGLGFADAAVILLCLVLSIGPAAHLMPRLGTMLLWRRHLGVAVAVAATLHVLAFETSGLLAVPSLFLEREGRAIGLQSNLAAGVSWIGLVALCYALVLALTSNDFAERLLKKGWRRLHGHSVTLFALVALHALLAFYFVSESRSILFPYLLWVAILATIALRVCSLVAVVRGLSSEQ